MTTQEDITRWLTRGEAQGARWMIVVCDTFDYCDYPVFIKTEEEFWGEYARHNGHNMQRIRGVYDLQMDTEQQLSAHRAMNLPPRTPTGNAASK